MKRCPQCGHLTKKISNKTFDHENRTCKVCGWEGKINDTV